MFDKLLISLISPLGTSLFFGVVTLESLGLQQRAGLNTKLLKKMIFC
jgi:hypothetical protein